MGKLTKTYEERIQEKDLRIEKLAQELKRYEAQKKQLEKRKKEEERKIRTHRLIEIGAAVESVLGRCIELEEIPKLWYFFRFHFSNISNIYFYIRKIQFKCFRWICIKFICIHCFKSIRFFKS